LQISIRPFSANEAANFVRGRTRIRKTRYRWLARAGIEVLSSVEILATPGARQSLAQSNNLWRFFMGRTLPDRS